MTDRELLDLAAKAAGIERAEDRFDCGLSITLTSGRHESLPQWNPLTDDGDALRLAVKLRLDIYNYAEDDDSEAYLEVVHSDGKGYGYASTELGDDPYAATRRAIVRAAAAIAEKA